MPARRLLLLSLLLVATAARGALPWGGGASAETRVPAPAAVPPGPAYWLATADGGVFAFGRALFAGSASNVPLQAKIAGLAATPSGDGYWLAAQDGGVFALGDAPFLGAAGEVPMRAAVVDIAGTPSGQGYWLASADGEVFAFGDAPWLGGLADLSLTGPVTAVVGTPSGQGYWLVARDGGVFAFGDATWLGGAADAALNRPVVDMAVTPSGGGYWLLAADGGVFAFGEAGFFGSASETVRGTFVGIAPTPSGHGYWLAGAKGGLFSFGDAGFYGSASDANLQAPVIGIASGLGTHVPAQQRQLTTTFGWDISWPQCGRPFPSPSHAFAIIGVTDGHAYSVNPCLAEQHQWSLRNGSLGGLYVNVNYPSRSVEPLLDLLMIGDCRVDDLGCQLYQWGVRGAAEAFNAATARGVSAPMWWLDVETMNRWSDDTAANSHIVEGAIDALQARGVKVGIYSTPYQWGVIAGDYAPGLPTWEAGPNNVHEAAVTCQKATSFAGGQNWIVQFPYMGFDGNILCDAGVKQAFRSFRLPPLPAVPVIATPDPRAH